MDSQTTIASSPRREPNVNDAHDNAQTDREALEKAFSSLRTARIRLKSAIAILTKRVDGESWSPKIAAAVPEIREALKLLGGK